MRPVRSFQSKLTNRRAFTLVELLVVIGVIGILVALLLPAVQAAREAARRMSCGNNLKQLGLALQLYHDVHKTFPPGVIGDDVRNSPGIASGAFRAFGWGALVLPFLEEGPLHQQLDFNIPIFAVPIQSDVNVNESVLNSLTMEEFLCPSDPRLPFDAKFRSAPNMSASSYVGNYGTNGYIEAPAGSGNVSWKDARWLGGFVNSLVPTQLINHRGVGPLGNNSRTSIRNILDGTSNTLFVAERRGDLTVDGSFGSSVTPSQAMWAGGWPYLVLGSAYYRPNKCDLTTIPYTISS